ncbi:hypothetical protein T492DRAFT_1111889 [Pavlovales sp. CCMP2436]|nr:hypothetical protein T492DRAFT_1111889 [Pavlovales sp. CCMP2436]
MTVANVAVVDYREGESSLPREKGQIRRAAHSARHSKIIIIMPITRTLSGATNGLAILKFILFERYNNQYLRRAVLRELYYFTVIIMASILV